MGGSTKTDKNGRKKDKTIVNFWEKETCAICLSLITVWSRPIDEKKRIAVLRRGKRTIVKALTDEQAGGPSSLDRRL